MQAIAQLGRFQTRNARGLEANCPASMRTPMVDAEVVWGGRKATFVNPESKIWLERMADKRVDYTYLANRIRRWRAEQRGIDNPLAGDGSNKCASTAK